MSRAVLLLEALDGVGLDQAAEPSLRDLHDVEWANIEARKRNRKRFRQGWPGKKGSWNTPDGTKFKYADEQEWADTYEQADNYMIDLIDAAEKKQREVKRNLTPAQKSELACTRCGGRGYLAQYGHNMGGVCFKCNGTGLAI